MQKTIFTIILCGLFFVAAYAEGNQKNNKKVEEACRYRVQSTNVSLQVSQATINNKASEQNIYLPNTINSSTAQLEALGTRYGWSKSNSQLNELGDQVDTRYGWSKSNSQLDELGSRYGWSK